MTQAETKAEAFIKEEIREYAHISLARYMELCLSHPEFGYYTRKDPFGANGDFTTAPEISQMFGELIAFWLVASWQSMGSPETLKLIEMGPGRGTLMADILRIFSKLPVFTPKLEVHMVEMSPRLIAAQKALLAKETTPLFWHRNLEDALNAKPQTPFLIIGNEFLDALPIQQFISFKEQWWERAIGLDRDEKLFFLLKKADLPPLPAELDAPHQGAIWEYSAPRERVIEQIAGAMHQQPGMALFIDYGFPFRSYGDSLQAMHKHAFVDALTHMGEADLTSHVDFASLADAAETHGAFAAPLITQKKFLEALGLSIRSSRLQQSAADEAQRLEIAAAEARLSEGGETGMGDLFKVFCFTSPTLSPPIFTPPTAAT